jgi:hypothetical protein
VSLELRDQIASVLLEHRRKAPRVQANLVVQLVQGRRPVLAEAVAEPVDVQPDPPRWSKYAERNAKWLEDGIATTRNRTHAAMTALGLDPNEVRAVVIEPDVVHIFRWADRGTRVGIGLPIIEEESA